MNQNENSVFGGQTDVDIALLRFGSVDISSFDLIPFKCQFHAVLPDVIFLAISTTSSADPATDARIKKKDGYSGSAG
jgi:hypothetical protein